MIKQDFVYAAQRSDGAIKIGWTSNLKQRIAGLHNKKNGKVVLIHSAPCYGDAYGVEQDVHTLLWSHRVEGEWFKAPQHLVIETIETVANPPTPPMLAYQLARLEQREAYEAKSGRKLSRAEIQSLQSAGTLLR